MVTKRKEAGARGNAITGWKVATKRWVGDDHGAKDEDTDKPVGLNDNVVGEADDMVDDEVGVMFYRQTGQGGQ